MKYQCAELQERARSFIFANFIAVTECEDFLNLNAKQVVEWIASDEIIVKGEEEVFVAILRWIEKNARRKKFFFELLRHVRCVYMSRNYLVTVVLQHELVKRKEQCSDLVLSVIKELSDGTEECFLNQPPRNCLKIHEDAIFACGGENGDETLCYLPSEDKWYKMADRRFKGNSFALAASACHGKLYVIGGKKVERYDPLLNSWTSVKRLKQVMEFASAVTFQGCLYVTGGVDSDDDRLSTVLRYNPDSNLWQEVASLGSPRACVCAIADGINMCMLLEGWIHVMNA